MRLVTPDQTRLCVQSLSAFESEVDRCHQPDTSGQLTGESGQYENIELAHNGWD
jgi:hypothetical protein